MPEKPQFHVLVKEPGAAAGYSQPSCGVTTSGWPKLPCCRAGAVNVLATVVAIVVVDRGGRRMLFCGFSLGLGT